jgi:hypothetical protein
LSEKQCGFFTSELFFHFLLPYLSSCHTFSHADLKNLKSELKKHIQKAGNVEPAEFIEEKSKHLDIC